MRDGAVVDDLAVCGEEIELVGVDLGTEVSVLRAVLEFRFLTAAVLSMLVLMGWSYFYTPAPPAKNTETAEANTS